MHKQTFLKLLLQLRKLAPKHLILILLLLDHLQTLNILQLQSRDLILSLELIIPDLPLVILQIHGNLTRISVRIALLYGGPVIVGVGEGLWGLETGAARLDHWLGAGGLQGLEVLDYGIDVGLGQFADVLHEGLQG